MKHVICIMFPSNKRVCVTMETNLQNTKMTIFKSE